MYLDALVAWGRLCQAPHQTRQAAPEGRMPLRSAKKHFLHMPQAWAISLSSMAGTPWVVSWTGVRHLDLMKVGKSELSVPRLCEAPGVYQKPSQVCTPTGTRTLFSAATYTLQPPSFASAHDRIPPVLPPFLPVHSDMYLEANLDLDILANTCGCSCKTAVLRLPSLLES